jgi:hypothetical protein
VRGGELVFFSSFCHWCRERKQRLQVAVPVAASNGWRPAGERQLHKVFGDGLENVGVEGPAQIQCDFCPIYFAKDRIMQKSEQKSINVDTATRTAQIK